MQYKEKKKIIGIIPTRLGSRRFPRKAMALILSLPLFAHVYKRAKLCNDLDDIIIVTPDDEIANFSKSNLNANYVKIPHKNLNPIEAAALGLEIYTKQKNVNFEIAVIISGDEPLITDTMIANAISPFYIDPSIKVTCLMCQIQSQEEFNDRNEIKVVVDNNNFALYFSREPIPSHFKGNFGIPPLKKVNVMPFDVEFLMKIVKEPPTPLEVIEEIPLLRVLELGYKVKMILNETPTFSVDTPEDLEKVKQIMKNDYFISRYISDLN